MQIKVCGITNIDDAKAALDAGADYLGFVLYQKSPRSVTLDQLVSITSALNGSACCIGVFVNESVDEIDTTVKQCGLYAAQIHGDESPEDFSSVSFKIWRAVRVHDRTAFPPPDDWCAERYVVDAAVSGLYGGTGVTADWEAASILADIYPIVLAGGLSPANVREAIRIVNPVGIDVSSGIESEPGKKDHSKLAAFIKAVKQT